MKFLQRPPTEINYVSMPGGGSTTPIDVFGPRRSPVTLVIGPFGGSQVSVVFGDANVALGDQMILNGITQYTLDPATRYMILENRQALTAAQVSWYVY